MTQLEGALAEPGQDFISGTGSVILQDGQTSVAIPVTILEVKVLAIFHFHLSFIKLNTSDQTVFSTTLCHDLSFHSSFLFSDYCIICGITMLTFFEEDDEMDISSQPV